MRKQRGIRAFSNYKTRTLIAHIDRGVLQFFSYVYGRNSKSTKKFHIKQIYKTIDVEPKPPCGQFAEDSFKVLLQLASTTRKGRRINKYLSINTKDKSKDFLLFCKEYQVPFEDEWDTFGHQALSNEKSVVTCRLESSSDLA
jgi:hypothetical protein